VVALKSMAGILSHDGHHAEASDLYRAVCRVDPGDLESQSALHQITSGEYAEVRPPELIVSQGERSWQPIRLTREEDHLRELALGLQTFETFEAGPARPAASAELPAAPDAILSPDDLTIGPSFPSERAASAGSDAPKSAVAPVAPPSRHEIIVPAGGFPEGGLHNRLGSLDVEEFQTSALERLDDALRPAPVRPLGEVEAPAPTPLPTPAAAAAPTPAPLRAPAPPTQPVELPESALVEETRPASTRSAVWDEEPASGPEVPARRDAAPPTIAGNRAAFEMWLRRLGGKS
jgi:hypothetical protein